MMRRVLLLAAVIFVGCTPRILIPDMSSIIKNDKPVVQENPWKPYAFCSNDDWIIVTYTNELGGEKSIKCKAVFETQREYKLVSSELGPGWIIHKANVTDFSISRQ